MRKLTLSALALSLSFTTLANAEDVKFLLSPEISNVHGNAKENVYYEGNKISELAWETKGVKMLSLNSKISYEKLRFGMTYGNSINDGSGQTMVDSDWFGTYNGSGCGNGDECYEGWTHRSWSAEKTTQVSNFDVNGYYDLFSNLSFGIGYRQTNFKWAAYGGSYVYSSTDSGGNLTGFRDQTGTLNGKVITYHQKVNIPYIGAEFRQPLFNKKLLLSVHGAYSPYATAQTRDNHILRDLIIKTKFNHVKYYNIGASIEYSLLQNASIGLKYDFNQIAGDKGNAHYNYWSSGVTISLNDGGGLSNKYSQTSLFLKYTFDIPNNIFTY